MATTFAESIEETEEDEAINGIASPAVDPTNQAARAQSAELRGADPQAATAAAAQSADVADAAAFSPWYQENVSATESGEAVERDRHFLGTGEVVPGGEERIGGATTTTETTQSPGQHREVRTESRYGTDAQGQATLHETQDTTTRGPLNLNGSDERITRDTTTQLDARATTEALRGSLAATSARLASDFEDRGGELAELEALRRELAAPDGGAGQGLSADEIAAQRAALGDRIAELTAQRAELNAARIQIEGELSTLDETNYEAVAERTRAAVEVQTRQVGETTTSRASHAIDLLGGTGQWNASSETTHVAADGSSTTRSSSNRQSVSLEGGPKADWSRTESQSSTDANGQTEGRSETDSRSAGMVIGPNGERGVRGQSGHSETLTTGGGEDQRAVTTGKTNEFQITNQGAHVGQQHERTVVEGEGDDARTSTLRGGAAFDVGPDGIEGQANVETEHRDGGVTRRSGAVGTARWDARIEQVEGHDPPIFESVMTLRIGANLSTHLGLEGEADSTSATARTDEDSETSGSVAADARVGASVQLVYRHRLSGPEA
ncbi:MAG: hypothetical protein KC620_21020, partial [Myxococcales bacterium]|nr:hypothetical protein [Myxococcales bacterium]